MSQYFFDTHIDPFSIEHISHHSLIRQLSTHRQL